MIKKVMMSIILCLTMISLAAAQSDSVRVFRIIDNEANLALDLDSLMKITDNKPAFVTVMVKFEEGKKINCSWMPFHPHASNDSSHQFYQEIERIIGSWSYDESIPGNGEIYYTVSVTRNLSHGNEGIVTIDLKSFSLPNYEKYAFPAAENARDLAIFNPRGFESKNIKMIMKKAQIPGSLEKSWLEKLTYAYVLAFSILLLLFILFSVYTIYKVLNKRAYGKKLATDYQNRIKELWADSQLTIYFNQEVRSLDIANPNLAEEIEFIGAIKNSLKAKQVENEKKYKDHTPNIDYDGLESKLDTLLKSEDKDSNLVLKKAQSLIWREYSEKFIQKAKDLCLEAEGIKKSDSKNEKDGEKSASNTMPNGNNQPCIRLNKIFLAGLENHLNNKTAFYTSSEIDRAIEKTAGSELEQMKGMMDGIWFIASVSPMVGLFGTVTGISKSFAQISAGGLEQSELITRLAGGINEALYTTIAGLILGMLATFTYYIIKTWIDRISAQWEELFIEITNRF